ncbi:S-layer homology domain-containing protein [Paenibacillus sp. sgz5001063]|uniref:S-layer homology domain-containing protein n=1 Tax=Paenibacillus sp. sgz5001063 TaxID=3242474 RepID=UPI0036D3F1F0
MRIKQSSSKVAMYLAILLFCMTVMPQPSITLAAPSIQAEDAPVQPWPSSFTAYTDSSGKIINDPANEPGISPDDVDFMSGLSKGAGDLPSFYVAGDGSNLFFRMRLLGDPRDDKGGYLSSVWLVKVSDGTATKAVIGLNGKSPHEDYIYISNNNGSVVHAVNKTDNSGKNVPGTRVTEDSNGDYFLDIQIPVASLTAIDSSITSASILKFAFATSKAANLAVINKDGQEEAYGDYAKLSPFGIYRPNIAIAPALQDAYTTFPASVTGTTANVANGQTVTLTIAPTSGNGAAVTKTTTITNNAWSISGITGIATGFSYLVTASVVNEKGYTATASQLTGIGASKVTITGNPSYSTYQFPTSFAGTFVRSATGNRNVLLSIYRLSGPNLATETLLTSTMRLGVTGNPGIWSIASISYINGSQPTPGSTYKIVAVDEDNANAKAVQVIKFLQSNITISSPANNTRSDVTTPNVIGTANPDETVKLYIDNVLSRQTIADSGGNWTISIDKPLTATPVNNYHTFKAVASDGSTEVASNIVNYGVSALDVSIENGSHPYIYLTTTEPVFRGRSTDTAVDVVITDDSDASQSYTWSNVPVTSGKWSVRTPSTFMLISGKNYTVTVSADNNNSVTATMHALVKTSTTISVISPVAASHMNVRDSITGISEPNAEVSLNLDQATIVNVTANNIGDWSYTPSSDWTKDNHTAEATTSDEAGNTASAATSFMIGSTSIASVTNVSYSAPYGTTIDDAKSALGSSVTVDLEDGGTATVPITWSGDSVPAYDGSVAGSYVFAGTFNSLPEGVNNNNSINASGTVHVLPPGTTNIVSAEDVSVNVPYSTTKEKAKEALGTIVEVTLDGGSKAAVPVAWDDESVPVYDGNYAAAYSFTGTLGPLPKGLDNTASVKAMGIVNVADINENQLKEAVRSLWIRYSVGDIWESVTLPVFLLKDGKYNTDITWTSNKPDVISIENAPADWGSAEGREFKAVVNRQAEDVSVILTANVAKGAMHVSRSFLLIVKSTNVAETKTTSPRNDSNIKVNDKEIPILINRTTLSDGSRIDKLIVSSTSMDKLLLAIGPGADLEMQFNDKPNGDTSERSDEITMEIPVDALDKLNNQAVQLTTPEGSVRLPAASVAQAKSSGIDLFFRIVPVRAETTRQTIFNDTLQNPLVRAEAGSKDIRMLDIPREIETNYSGFATEVTLPLTYLSIPSDPTQRQLYLDSLRVFIQHSDGSEAIVRGTGPNSIPGEIITSNGAATGLKFTIDKFSTFSFFQVTDPVPTPVPTAAPTAAPTAVPTAAPTADPSSGSPMGSSTPVFPEKVKVTTGTVSLIDHQLELKLDQPLAAGTLSTEGLTVTIAGKPVQVQNAEITADKRLVLTLGEPIQAGMLIRIEYKAPSSASTVQSKSLESFTLEILNSMIHNKYINGYPDGTFKPGHSITRAEMAAILTRLLGTTQEKITVKPYPDVKTTHWASSGIQLMKDTGIMKGYPDGLFHPEKSISRGEMAAVILAFKGKTASSELPLTYSDTAGHWAKYAAEELKTEGIMIGGTDGKFHPQDNLTRAEAVVAMNKVLKRGGLTGDFDPTWPDTSKSDWSYAQIEEASHSHESTRVNDMEERWIRFINN